MQNSKCRNRRAAITERRKTQRMRCEAAGAANATRAPQDLPRFHPPSKERQKSTRPGDPEVSRTMSLVRPRPPARGASISPTESEGIAEGDDEDEAGEVRSEGSGPQSWPRVLGVVAVPGGSVRIFVF
jgi:hypothetical protein